MSRRFHWMPAAAAALACGLLLGACAPAGDRDASRVAGREAEDEPSHEIEDAAPAAPSDASLFDLTFALTDQNGRPAHMADLEGRPFVASMIYTNCTSVCPRVTADLKNLESALPKRDRERIRFVLFSLDPERDSPEALRKFAADHSLDTTRWTLFATSPDDMRTLAAVLGVRYRPDEGGEIAHSAVIAVVDGGGVVRHRQVGIENDSSPLVAAVSEVR